MYALNRLANAVSGFMDNEDWNKLSAVADFADVSDSKSLIQFAGKLDLFIYIPNIQNQEKLARYWIEHNDEYELSSELEDYFLFDQFGEQLENGLGGRFTDTGYVCIEEGYGRRNSCHNAEYVKEKTEHEENNNNYFL